MEDLLVLIVSDAERFVTKRILDLALSIALIFVDDIVNIEASACLLIPLVLGADQSFAQFVAVFRARIVRDTERSRWLDEVCDG